MQNASSLKELMHKFLAHSPFQPQILTATARLVWFNCMPKMVCNSTSKLYVHQNKVFLKITSSTLRHDLQNKKEQVKEMFQQSLHQIEVLDVVFI